VLRRKHSGLEPGLSSVADRTRLPEALAATEKACATVRLGAVDCGAHKEAGVAFPVSWVARQAGTTGAEARQP
jgi:hypothetical protein